MDINVGNPIAVTLRSQRPSVLASPDWRNRPRPDSLAAPASLGVRDQADAPGPLPVPVVETPAVAREMRTIRKPILAPGFAIRAALPYYGSAAIVSRTSSLVVAISSGSNFLRGCDQGSLTDGPAMASDLFLAGRSRRGY
jgi:hypothetical protein